MKSKKLNLIFCAIVLACSIHASSNTKMVKSPKINLEIIGLGEENVLTEGIKVTLFKQDEKLGWINQGSIAYDKSSLSMSLVQNNNYIIKITKKGYVSRTYCFSTLFNDKETVSEIKFSFDLNFFMFNNEAECKYSDLSFTLTSNCPTSIIGVNKF